MSIITRQKRNITILEPKGSLTLAKKDFDLQKAIITAQANGVQFFVINMGSVSYLDSTGLGELTAIQKQINQKGGKLRLSNLTGSSLKLFQISNLNKVFEIFNDEIDALDDYP